MRALVCKAYGPPESLVIEEWESPAPGPGQVMIDVVAAGINFPDVLVVAGKYQVKTPPPFIPGNEATGIVAALGEGARRFAIGDRVIVTTRGGAFADQCVADEHATAALPDEFDFDQGAGFAVTYGTAYHAFRQCAGLEAGQTVLVLGAAGGTGSAAVELAATMGARVIAAASDADKLGFARDAGAHETIDYGTVSLRDAVDDLTGGTGVDVVFDPVGGELAEQAFRSLAWHGRYLVIGFASGTIPSFAGNIALLKEASVTGVWWGTWLAKHPEQHLANVRELAALIEDGKLKPRVTETYPLEDYAAAFRSITERRARGKVILRLR
jgi:NADPH2:quinone reductase